MVHKRWSATLKSGFTVGHNLFLDGSQYYSRRREIYRQFSEQTEIDLVIVFNIKSLVAFMQF